ncbi:MAG: hypothetical protein DBX02_03325 [Verrucomicrobia bacterium]|nr:MAG: hypothetical protein DBX02_03325 [Verrucomicrobiota bacterium]|tara:strand:- start:117 stop:677 length:561 start_codon:yes stop_codon:yes gene_type:complete
MIEKKYGVEDLDHEVLSPNEINNILVDMANEISKDFQNLNLTILSIMNGGLFMSVDLIRLLRVSCQIDSIKVNSYTGDVQSEDVFFISNDDMSLLKNRDVLIVDEIFDSGSTMRRVVNKLNLIPGISSVRSATLLMKNKKREIDYVPDYIGFNVEDVFMVGYGLDFFGNYRDLPSIGVLKSDKICK